MVHLRSDMPDTCNGEVITDANTTRDLSALTCTSCRVEVLDAGDLTAAEMRNVRGSWARLDAIAAESE